MKLVEKIVDKVTITSEDVSNNCLNGLCFEENNSNGWYLENNYGQKQANLHMEHEDNDKEEMFVDFFSYEGRAMFFDPLHRTLSECKEVMINGNTMYFDENDVIIFNENFKAFNMLTITENSEHSDINNYQLSDLSDNLILKFHADGNGYYENVLPKNLGNTEEVQLCIAKKAIDVSTQKMKC